MGKGIEENVRARRVVKDLLELVPDMLDGISEHRFWEILATEAAARVNCVLASTPEFYKAMNDIEAKEFEQTIVPFGKYTGRRVHEVPPEYWAYSTGGAFGRRLVAYTRSKHYRRRVFEQT